MMIHNDDTFKYNHKMQFVYFVSRLQFKQYQGTSIVINEVVQKLCSIVYLFLIYCLSNVYINIYIILISIAELFRYIIATR